MIRADIIRCPIDLGDVDIGVDRDIYMSLEHLREVAGGNITALCHIGQTDLLIQMAVDIVYRPDGQRVMDDENVPVEHLTRNEKVVSSILTSSSKKAPRFI